MKSLFGSHGPEENSARLARFCYVACNTIAVLLLTIAFAGAALADCVCQCVNGELAAICTGNVAVAPQCAPRSCPAPTSGSSMPRNLQVSSQGGGSDCAPQQVMDPVTGKYEWKVLCR